MRRVVLAAAVLAASACGSPAATPQANLALWTPPPDWVTVSAGGAFDLAIPPTMGASDDSGGIFANEPPPGAGAEIPFQLMALGPSADDWPQPGQDLAAWIDTRLADRGMGVPTVTRVVLPAGPATRYERVDRAGTPDGWHFVAFAIVTFRGVAYLQLDGPEAAWAAHAELPDRIATTLRYR